MLNRPFAIPMSQSSSWQRALREATTEIFPLAPGSLQTRGPWAAPGGYGYLYLPDGDDEFAVKVTGDPSDADAWRRVVEMCAPDDFPALPIVDCIETLEAYGNVNGKLARFYLIGMERLLPQPAAAASFYGDYAHYFIAATGGQRGIPVIAAMPAPAECIVKLLSMGAEFGVTPEDIYAVLTTLRNLQSIGVYVFNLTADTVKRHPVTGRPMLTDLGAVTLDTECPVALDVPEIIAAANKQVGFRARHLNLRR